MAFRKGLHNFSKGELAPELWGRTDIAPYAAGVRQARNVLILKYGGLTFRPGFEFVSPWYDETRDGRLFPFQFDEGKSGQNYALEMGQGYMRPAAGGGMVVEEILTVTGVSNTNPVVVTIPYHAYAAGDDWAVSGVLGAVEINDQVWRITGVLDANRFTINADGTAWGVFTGDSPGGITRTAPPAPPPPPPTVPPVVEPDPPPVVVPPYQPPRYCVTDDTPILMADGTERAARDLAVGDVLRTRHELTLEWGDYAIEAIAFADEPVFAANLHEGVLRGTEDHRIWRDPLGWVRLGEIGLPAGRARVAKITVADAHTYISMGVLSHNIKQEQRLDEQ